MILLLQTATELDSEPGQKPGVEPGVKPGSGCLGRQIEGLAPFQILIGPEIRVRFRSCVYGSSLDTITITSCL